MKQNNNTFFKRYTLWIILAICAAPLVASYFSYYVIKPTGRVNYGTLLDPKLYPLPNLMSVDLAGKKTALTALQGKWLMLQIDEGQCTEYCQQKLLDTRQLRLAQGREMTRIERVWIITDNTTPTAQLTQQHPDLHYLRVSLMQLQSWLPTEPNTKLSDHIYLIDPLGNVMMRYPKKADPNKIKKDLARLLKASRIG